MPIFNGVSECVRHDTRRPSFLLHRAYFIENKMENGQAPRGRACTQARVVNPYKLSRISYPVVSLFTFTTVVTTQRFRFAKAAASGSKFQFYNVNCIFPRDSQSLCILDRARTSFLQIPLVRSRSNVSSSYVSHPYKELRKRPCSVDFNSPGSRYYTWKWSTMAHCVRAGEP